MRNSFQRYQSLSEEQRARLRERWKEMTPEERHGGTRKLGAGDGQPVGGGEVFRLRPREITGGSALVLLIQRQQVLRIGNRDSQDTRLVLERHKRMTAHQLDGDGVIKLRVDSKSGELVIRQPKLGRQRLRQLRLGDRAFFNQLKNPMKVSP